jgi:glycosyltransferase involved in cell wall biosynthesis
MTKTSVKPLVSIIIPTYNQSKLLEKTIKSAQMQNYENIEILVIDDQSTDDTSLVVADIALNDSRVKYFTTERQSNLPAIPRNIGIRNSQGELIAFLDHDDLWRRKKLAVQIEEFFKSEDTTMVFSPLWQFSGLNYFWGLVLLRPPIGNVDQNSLLAGNPIQCSSVLVRKDALISLGGFSESKELRAVEDYELWIRLSKQYKIVEIYKVLGYYRHVRTSTSQNENMSKRIEALQSIHPYVRNQGSSSAIDRVLRRISITARILTKLRF